VCDSLVAMTGDGPLFAKNGDRDANEAQVLGWVAAADHPDGDRVSGTWIDVPQVAHSHADLISRPRWMWGAEMGANEHGVAVGNEAVFTRGGGEVKPERALLGMDLLRLVLERAGPAEQAVSMLVELLERHGQGGPCSYERPGFTYDNSFLVVDLERAIVLETAGREWATERVTGPGRSISNGPSIPTFARARDNTLRSWLSSGSTRRGLTEAMACRATGPADLMEVLRSHGANSSPTWPLVHGGLAAPCVHSGGPVASGQTTAWWVSDLRGVPHHWATGTSAPCTSVFKPVGIGDPVGLGPTPTDVLGGRSPWWRHEPLHRSTMVAHSALLRATGTNVTASRPAGSPTRLLPRRHSASRGSSRTHGSGKSGPLISPRSGRDGCAVPGGTSTAPPLSTGTSPADRRLCRRGPQEAALRAWPARPPPRSDDRARTRCCSSAARRAPPRSAGGPTCRAGREVPR